MPPPLAGISLTLPATWDASNEGLVMVASHTHEFREVVQYFKDNLFPYGDRNRVFRVDRVQSTELWMSYEVKKEAMRTKYSNNPGSLVNANITEIEKRWLFHGTCAMSAAKITKRGFNRAFAGRNATRYGKGVYFSTSDALACNKCR